MTDPDDAYLAREVRARREIDKQLAAAGWTVQGKDEIDVNAGPGVATREFPLEKPHGRVDYLLFVDGQPVGVIEAKAEGTTLVEVEHQSGKYVEGLPEWMEPPLYPLPFIYESTGTETRFTNGYDPDARSRRVFTFHRPETLAEWVRQIRENPYAPTFRARLQSLTELDSTRLWEVQATAIANLEESLREDRPRALIQMATGSGKTFTAANISYRLIRHADAKRILFLVDRASLGEQAKLEFDKFDVPDTQRKFPAEYNIQHLKSNTVDSTSRVCISTIQRIFSILHGDAEMDEETDEHSVYELPVSQPVTVEYTPKLRQPPAHRRCAWRAPVRASRPLRRPPTGRLAARRSREASAQTLTIGISAYAALLLGDADPLGELRSLGIPGSTSGRRSRRSRALTARTASPAVQQSARTE